jgi:dihydroorotate dehydrogenase
MPKCIYAKPFSGIALNALGLSGPGARALFETGRWQAREEPFFISFMSIGKDPDERLEELIEFVELFEEYLPQFRASVGLQINYSCPNVGLHLDGLLKEVTVGLHFASMLGIPLMPKFNVMLPVEAAQTIGDHPRCDALCISNTIPYGQLPEKIDWQKLFGTVSPLAKFGGGGLSGKLLFPLVLDWVTRIRATGFTKPINAGGGIFSLDGAERMMNAGADSVFLGSIAFMRPWRVRKIGQALNSLF